LFANVGTWVANFFVFSPSPGGSNSFLNSPEIWSPREEIDYTLPDVTTDRKTGV
jgi:hypothetical protein